MAKPTLSAEIPGTKKKEWLFVNSRHTVDMKQYVGNWVTGVDEQKAENNNKHQHKA